MPQLRPLISSSGFALHDQVVTQDSAMKENLQMLFEVRDFRCTAEVLVRLPNLKKLGIFFFHYGEKRSTDWSYYCLHNLSHLHKLEILYVGCEDLLLENITFPTSLKTLLLDSCNIPWKEMTTLASLLPNLEWLELQRGAFKGPEWDLIEGEFHRLKVLIIGECELKWWRAENNHLPNLKSLVLRFTHQLQEIY
ncbi:UNVERIFIED_CONTAM: hypothetical protein Sradi_0032500 [Sesamum radiatum]|uniref:Disease resistance protein n=1 Tax=Sesamum radiatum TaxID=300843 RepID=A0AAW2WM91_SESRA